VLARGDLRVWDDDGSRWRVVSQLDVPQAGGQRLGSGTAGTLQTFDARRHSPNATSDERPARGADLSRGGMAARERTVAGGAGRQRAGACSVRAPLSSIPYTAEQCL
jgi:hypothetical protein